MIGVVFFQVGGEFRGSKFAAPIGVYLAWVELSVCYDVLVGEEEVRLLFEEVEVFGPDVVSYEYDEVGYVGEASCANFD